MSDPRDPYPGFGEPPVADLDRDTESSAEIGDAIAAYCDAARTVLPQAHFQYVRRFRHPDGDGDRRHL
jgi:hypothetical protein